MFTWWDDFKRVNKIIYLSFYWLQHGAPLHEIGAHSCPPERTVILGIVVFFRKSNVPSAPHVTQVKPSLATL